MVLRRQNGGLPLELGVAEPSRPSCTNVFSSVTHVLDTRLRPPDPLYKGVCDGFEALDATSQRPDERKYEVAQEGDGPCDEKKYQKPENACARVASHF